MGRETAKTTFVIPEIGLPGCFAESNMVLTLPIWSFASS